MNYEELAFANQQLAGMLKSGIPLEGSIKQLCATMRSGVLRTELSALEADLGRGTPIKEALAARRLPAFYKQMVTVGAKANDLPSMLTLLADHYSRSHVITTRLKGLMVYPALVLLFAMGLSITLAVLFEPMVMDMTNDLGVYGFVTPPFGLWLMPTLLSVMVVVLVVALLWSMPREYLRWRLPGFKDANLSHLAASLHLMITSGIPLPEALSLAGGLEQGSAASRDLQLWQSLIANGSWKTRAANEAPFTVIPPLFLWLAADAGEDPARGLGQAAEIYERRANHRVDMFLFAALPVGIVIAGLLIVNQFMPMFLTLIRLMDMLGGD